MIKSIKKISKKHYIQCGLTMLLTGLVLYFTSALWYSKAVIVSFNAEAKKEIQYQVFYTEEHGQHYNEKQSVKQNVKSGNEKVEILLPIEKVVKIRLDIGVQPGEVVISDLQVKGSKNVKLNYNEFNKNQIDKYEIRGNKLYITSNQGDPYLPYKSELNLPAGYQVDWCRFIIISVLSFLLMYKFVQYLSKFKIEKQHSRIDIVMLAVFFVLLFVPMSHISDAEKSEQENRMLAKKPQLIIDRGGNNYGVQFDAWYNDHFFGRDAMMGLYQNIKYFITPMLGNDKTLVGKDGWLFFKPDNGMNNYANITELSENDMANGLRYLQSIDDWCEKHNKKFYYMIIPDKSKIYGEYYRLIRKQRSDDYGIAMQFVNYIRKNSDIKVIYPKDELLKHKKDGLVYYKDDTHWSDFGAYWAYEAITDVISKDYEIEKISINKWQDKNILHNSSDLYKLLNKHYNNNVIYKYPEYLRKTSCTREAKYARQDEGLIECENKENKFSIFVLRDSFFSWLISYMADTFNKTKILWKYSLETEDIKDIEQNYDIVILENVERYIPQILNQKFLNLPKEN